MIDSAKIDRALRSDAVPNVVALVTTKDQTIYQSAHGHRDPTHPMTLDTIFALASMTKAITSVAAMQLVEQGRLALDAAIAETLPALANPQVLQGFDAAGAPILVPATRPITLRQLLTHSSGYGYVTWNAPLLRYHDHTKTPSIPSSDAELAAIPLVFDPGSSWNYSISTDLVGRAIEAVTRQPLEAYLRANLLDPLGMHDTAATLTAEQRARMAGMLARHPDGTLHPTEFNSGRGIGYFGGGGSLCGTGPDYARFLRMLLGGGPAILRPETIADMARNHIGELDMLPMRTALPRSNDLDFFPTVPKKWGLGFLINTKDIPGRRHAGSLAWAGIANTYFWVDPTAGIAGILLTQILPFADQPALDLLEAFETAVYAAL